MRCVLCNSNKRLEVHHTREKALPENLMTLCHLCHKNFARSYFAFKRKIREFNDFRLNKENSQEEVIKKKDGLLNEINKNIKKSKEVWNSFKKSQHKTLDNF